ncbi:hypothetical protein E4U14_006433 [Claviceps sp. LM454 group G7]|nr:hypothetical protein E4U14_006433 [Claviceps sp. LM454 group G7]
MAAFDEIWESSLVCHRDQQWWEDRDDEELDEKLSTQVKSIAYDASSGVKHRVACFILRFLTRLPVCFIIDTLGPGRTPDIDFILNAQQAWADKYARGRSFYHGDDGGDIYSPGKNICYAPSFDQHVLQHSRGELAFDGSRLLRGRLRESSRTSIFARRFLGSHTAGIVSVAVRSCMKKLRRSCRHVNGNQDVSPSDLIQAMDSALLGDAAIFVGKNALLKQIVDQGDNLTATVED